MLGTEWFLQRQNLDLDFVDGQGPARVTKGNRLTWLDDQVT